MGIVNPLLTGDVESAIGFFESKARSGDTVPEYTSSLKSPANMARKAMETSRDFTTTYPRSSHYNTSSEEPSSDDSRAFMEKYAREYGTQMGWYDTPNLDVDLRNLDLTPRAAEMFTSFDTFEGTFNNVKQMGDLMTCLQNANPQELLTLFENWGPPQLVRLIGFIKVAASIYKTKINSFRDALIGLMLPIVIRPLMSAFMYMDQMIALSYNTTMSFVSKLKISGNVFCNKEPDYKTDYNSTLEECSEYIEEGARNVLGWLENTKDDIERVISASNSQMRDATALLKKIAITKKLVDMIKDMMG